MSDKGIKMGERSTSKNCSSIIGKSKRRREAASIMFEGLVVGNTLPLKTSTDLPNKSVWGNSSSSPQGSSTGTGFAGIPVISRSAPSGNWQRFLSAQNAEDEGGRIRGGMCPDVHKFQLPVAKEVDKASKKGAESTVQPFGCRLNEGDSKLLKVKKAKTANRTEQFVGKADGSQLKQGVNKMKIPSENKERVTRVVAIDCEMVGVADPRKSMLARVSVVDSEGNCILDKFVQPTEPVYDYRTWVSGIRPRDLQKGEPYQVVRQEVMDLLKNRIVVGHAVSNDFKALKMKHPKSLIRDTSRYAPFRQMNDGRTPSLKFLARSVLGVTIQGGEHSSVQDAKATLQLYMMYQKEWEEEVQRKHLYLRN